MVVLEFDGSAIQDEAGVSAAVEAVVNRRQDEPLVLVAGMGKRNNVSWRLEKKLPLRILYLPPQ